MNTRPALEWRQYARRNLLTWMPRAKHLQAVQIHRRPDSPVFWIMKDGHAKGSAVSLLVAQATAEALFDMVPTA